MHIKSPPASEYGLLRELRRSFLIPSLWAVDRICGDLQSASNPSTGIEQSMPKLPLAPALFLLLSGCATTTELSNKEPKLQFSSSKSARDFAACISTKWGEKRSSVVTNLLPNGYTVSIVYETVGADAVATIVDSESGSSIKYSERLPSLSPSWMSEYVKSCQ